MKIYIVTNSENRVVASGTTPIGESSIEIDVNIDNYSNLHSMMSNISSCIYQDGELLIDDNIVIDKLRYEKEEELDKNCKESITNGFYHTINELKYKFSFDVEAQLNFQGARDLLNSGILTSISWTVRKDGVYERILITKEIMNELTIVMLMHKDRNIRKYREQLLPLLKNAKTKEEVEAINWNSL